MKEKSKTPEGDLCAAFMRYVAGNSDWIAYPETGRFDIVLAGPDGAQIGIQAKVNFNATLLRQVLPPEYYDDYGPDYRGVLLPKNDPEIHQVCDALGLLYFYQHGDDFFPGLMDRERWEDWQPLNRLELPAYVPDIGAGMKHPIRLTEWKVKALKLIALIDVRGHVTRKDFRDLGLDHRRWTHPMSHWTELTDDGLGYVRGDRLIFDKQHPTVFAKIVEETRERLKKETLL